MTDLPCWSATGNERCDTAGGHFARANDHWKMMEQEDPHSPPSSRARTLTCRRPTTRPSRKPARWCRPGPTSWCMRTGWPGDARPGLDAGAGERADRPHEAEQAGPGKCRTHRMTTSTMLRGIVGVELAVRQLEGVWKMNQHRPDAARPAPAPGCTGPTRTDRELERAMAETLGSGG